MRIEPELAVEIARAAVAAARFIAIAIIIAVATLVLFGNLDKGKIRKTVERENVGLPSLLQNRRRL